LQRGHTLRDIFHQCCAKRFVAAFNQVDFEADLPQHQRQRAAALAPTPAVNQRLPVLGQRQHLALDVACDVGRHHGCAVLLSFKRIDLFVHGAHEDAFFVVEHGPVDRVWQVVERVLVFAACVDDGAESAGCTEGNGHSANSVLR